MAFPAAFLVFSAPTFLGMMLEEMTNVFVCRENSRKRCAKDDELMFKTTHVCDDRAELNRGIAPPPDPR